MLEGQEVGPLNFDGMLKNSASTTAISRWRGVDLKEGDNRLSRSQLVMNSERVTIETCDRYRSEIILSSRTLVRHIDYNIDYEAGTLFFKEPVFSRDQDLNPIPWAGAQIGSSMERHYDENGERVLANLGLVQTWKINEHWSMSGGLDRSQTLSQDESLIADAAVHPDVPPPVGSVEDFTAVSLGTSYKQEYWSSALGNPLC
jgi:hypothetical protein